MNNCGDLADLAHSSSQDANSMHCKIACGPVKLEPRVVDQSLTVYAYSKPSIKEFKQDPHHIALDDLYGNANKLLATTTSPAYATDLDTALVTSTLTNCPPTFDLDHRMRKIGEMYSSNPLASQLLEIETVLADELMKLEFGKKVTHVYNPVDYAYEPHLEYYRKFCQPSAQVLMVGMNPGPYGMSQTGVPFGEVNTVSQWMQICEPVGSPSKMHSKRPISGFDCKRSEVSGSRIWSFLRENFITPDTFFKRCFIYNYCPLSFMTETGKNFTPSELPAAVRHKLTKLCDDALLQSISLFPNCASLVGVGRFSEDRIKRVCKSASLTHKQMYLLHPSPQNPHANKNWKSVAQKCFVELGLLSSLPQSELVNKRQVSPELESKDVKRKLFKQEVVDEYK